MSHRQKRRAATHIPCLGDKVLIKQQKMEIKPPFYAKPNTVIVVNDTQVNAIRGI